MADAEFSAAPHPAANPGYGKRSAPYQLPPAPTDFAHLPPREAAIAAYIDRLDDGSDISAKTLAKHLPYGQCAMRTALNRVTRAGHLRRGVECIDGLWITRTWWSRTARDDSWWSAFQRGDVPRQRPTRTRAYVLLAALGRTNSAMSLSHAECRALSPLVDEWFARDATEDDVLRALTSGLPSPVHHPFAMARTRLIRKLPPEPVRRARPTLRLLECAKCGVPGRADALRDGTCNPCRGEPPTSRPRTTVPAARVHAHAAAIRAREGTPA
ncbi:hypothetical protein J7E93_05970 [Streptomyces sp. ISL-36]|uniref:hypothetical protein n=1 Tax=Streptomyces sp. ISL-36 TaxID=2819182 RepID=UPI001BE9DAEC|nr:hypothetical protein [Streptomyces sp. ISL-36]MBT2439674.1 hypothetical protein [Streptomyces sp. ISL-36]